MSCFNASIVRCILLRMSSGLSAVPILGATTKFTPSASPEPPRRRTTLIIAYDVLQAHHVIMTSRSYDEQLQILETGVHFRRQTKRATTSAPMDGR